MKVIYHANCNDGFCCAYLIHKKYNLPIENFVPMNYAGTLDQTGWEEGEEVWIVDFSFPNMKDYINKYKVTWIDHHITAKEQYDSIEASTFPLDRCPTCVFDINHSAAWLVNKFLGNDDNILVNYVQDRDLWQWKLFNSREISEYISIQPKTLEPETFKAWDRLETDLQHRMDKVKLVGYYLTLAIDRKIEEAVKHAQSGFFTVPGFGTFKIGIVNSTVYFSEIAGQLAEDNDFGICWWFDGKYQYSLRSKGNMDVSKVAKAFGGGGHKNAAGFESDKLIYTQTSKIPEASKNATV